MKKSFYTNQDQAITDKLWAEALGNLNKEAVQSVDITEKINNIVNNSQKKKFKSVAEKVNDMISRSGFDKFKKTQVKVSQAQAIPSESKPKTGIKLFETNPSVKTTIDNICSSSKGLLSIPAILSRAKNIHNSEVADDSLWTDTNFLSYIAKSNLSCKVQQGDDYSSNLGTIDYNNSDVDNISNDVFSALEGK